MTESRKKSMRTCVGCGKIAPKAQLLRFVRCADGSVDFDPSGRLAGRGAYVCSSECFAKVSKKRKLERCLRANMGADSYERLGVVLQGAELALRGSEE